MRGVKIHFITSSGSNLRLVERTFMKLKSIAGNWRAISSVPSHKTVLVPNSDDHILQEFYRVLGMLISRGLRCVVKNLGTDH